MKEKEKENLINDLLDQIGRKENEFPIIDEKGKILFPVLSNGVRTGWEERTVKKVRFGVGGVRKVTEVPRENLRGYSGYCVEINDHGNVTVWKCAKSGKRREIASRV